MCDDVDDDCDGAAQCIMSLSDADAEYTGEDTGDFAGTSLGAADVNGDGYGDLIVGAPGAFKAYLVLGSASPSSA